MHAGGKGRHSKLNHEKRIPIEYETSRKLDAPSVRGSVVPYVKNQNLFAQII